MRGVLRVVLDTNVVVSALVFPSGPASALRGAWQADRFEPLVSVHTARELVRVLGYAKFALQPAEQEDLLADYLPWTHVVRIPDRVSGAPACRDPLDVPFLELAIAGRADVLVSGDRDLLALHGTLGECEIVDLHAFVERIVD